MSVQPGIRYFLRLLLFVLLSILFSLLVIRFSLTSTRTQLFNKQVTNDITNSQNIFSSLSQDYLAPRLCEPKQKIIFAKTHKTGSSTIQNILMRYGMGKNLSFVLPNRKSWMFPLTESFNTKMVADLSPQQDLMLFHHIWNATEIRKLIPSGLTVTLLRDPVDTFESGYVYLGLQRGYQMDINQFAAKRARFGATRPKRALFNKNPQLYDLGLNQSKLEDTTEVIKKIQELDKEFDFVMIAEFMDESLILLQEILCWPLIDLTYLIQNQRKENSKSNMTQETRRILREWLWADYLLYNHFMDKFIDRTNQFGKDYLEFQVGRLQELNKKVEKECVLSHSDNSKLKGGYKMALDIVLGYVVDESKPWCKQYALSEPSFWKMIYWRQNRQQLEQNKNI